MPTLNLKNITIKEKQDSQNRTYYLIVDNETDKAYFCFEGTVKEGWQNLVSNWGQIKEVEIEFTESEQGFRIYRRVIGFWASQEGEMIV